MAAPAARHRGVLPEPIESDYNWFTSNQKSSLTSASPEVDDMQIGNKSEFNSLELHGTSKHRSIFFTESTITEISMKTLDRWSAKEDDLLTKCVEQHGNEWRVINGYFPNRNPEGLRKRWRKLKMQKKVTASQSQSRIQLAMKPTISESPAANSIPTGMPLQPLNQPSVLLTDEGMSVEELNDLMAIVDQAAHKTDLELEDWIDAANIVDEITHND